MILDFKIYLYSNSSIYTNINLESRILTSCIIIIFFEDFCDCSVSLFWSYIILLEDVFPNI